MQNVNTLPENALFVGAARNCSKYLPAALNRWSALSRIFSGSRFLVAENDSTDDTKAVLDEWRRSGDGRNVVSLDGLAETGASRSQALAVVRNSLLEAAYAEHQARPFSYLIVMDMDEASLAITPGRLWACMQMPGWDALFANQLFYYDDVWALRHEGRSPDDWVWRVETSRWPALARLGHLTWRNRPIWPWQRPLRVSSAFGGFGIYRWPLVCRAAYGGSRNGRDICEHVPFNEALSAQGARLFLHPGLVNMLPMPLYRLWSAHLELGEARPQ